MAFTAVFDAFVVYSAPLCDPLLHLATAKLFRAHWTDMIHYEWIKAAIDRRPDIDPATLTHRRELINAHAEDCLVTEFEPLIGAMSLPAPDDRHVVAAAVKCGADVIVTFNLRDFPDSALGVYGMEAQHPNVFVRHLIDLRPGVVVTSVRTVRSRLTNSAISADKCLLNLERQGLFATAAELRVQECNSTRFLLGTCHPDVSCVAAFSVARNSSFICSPQYRPRQFGFYHDQAPD